MTAGIDRAYILIHEAMHVTETMMIDNDLMKKRINHDFIEAASYTICALLSATECLNFTEEDFKNLE